jgi:hypothetical protein
MKYGYIGYAIMGVVFPMVLAGCVRPNGRTVAQKIVIENVSDSMKHSPRTVKDENWIAEVWVSGTALTNGRVPTLTIRLTPIVNTDDERVPQAKASFRMFSQPERVLLAQTQSIVDFQDCAKMKPRRDTIVNNGTIGETELFPPAAKCFEWSVRDPFDLEGNIVNGKVFTRGKYELIVELAIQNGPSFIFQSIPLRNLGGR